jgi:hypothetical protein
MVRDSVTFSSSGTSSISEHWERRDLETGWQILHMKIVEFRKTHQITILQFLKLCNLPSKSYYRQLCCSTGNSLHPSNKVGTSGKTFLERVTNFFEEFDNSNQISLTERDLEGDICDLQMDGINDLHKIKIRDLIYNKVENRILVKCLPDAVEDEMMNFLNAKLKIEEDVGITFCQYELLYSPPPYTVVQTVNDHILMGTTTPVNITGSLVLITCAHCVGEFQSPIQSNSFGDQLVQLE